MEPTEQTAAVRADAAPPKQYVVKQAIHAVEIHVDAPLDLQVMMSAVDKLLLLLESRYEVRFSVRQCGQ